jgi:hypothetical protein
MGQFDEVVERLTDRLRIDPELRMDISHELKTHLEDSADEFRQAGYDEAEASETAVKAFGDETELSQQLWLANRGRIRVRQVIKWSARIVLIPLSIAMIFVGLTGFSSVISSLQKISGRNGNYGSNIPGTRSLSEEERFIFFGDPSAKTDVGKQKSISDRWPENPIYYANYVNSVLNSLERAENDSPAFYHDPAKALDVLPLLTKGEQIEVENGFYNIAKAGILFNISSTLKEYPKLTYITRDSNGKEKTSNYRRVMITDPERFKQGVEEFRKGVFKPIHNSHSMDMLRVRLGLLPPVNDFVEYISRSAYGIPSALPMLGYERHIARMLCAYSLELTNEGKINEAKDLLNITAMFGSKRGASGETLIELLVGQAIYQLPLAYEIQGYQLLGLPVKADAAKKQLKVEEDFLYSLRHPPEYEKKNREQLGTMYAGTMDRLLLPAMGGEKTWNFGPAREMDYVLYKRIGVLIIFIVLVEFSLIFVTITGVNLLRWRKDKEGPKLFFVGWRALVKIGLLAVVLPIAIYGIYLYGLPTAGKYAFSFAWARLFLEFFLVGGSIIVLTLMMSYSAIRRRAMEAGMVVPPEITIRKRRWSVVLIGLSVVSIAGLIVYWYMKVDWYASRVTLYGNYANQDINDVLEVGIFIMPVLIIWLIRELVYLIRLPREYAHFRRTFFRSIVPILSLVVIVSSLCLGYPLRMKERQVARELPVFGLYDEVGKSDYRLLRERLRQRYEELQKSIARP